MDRYKFADALFDLRFYSEYNAVLHQVMADASGAIETRFFYALTLLSFVSLVLSALTLFATAKALPWIWQCNVVSLTASIMGCVIGVIASSANHSAITAQLYEAAARWEETKTEVEQLGLEFKALPDDATIPDRMVNDLARIQNRRGKLDEFDARFSPPQNIQEECYSIVTERIYGKNIKSQDDVDKLKKDNYERWARAQYAVPPKRDKTS